MNQEKPNLRPAPSNELVRLADSTREIARMREEWRRDNRFLAERGLIHPGMADRNVLDEYRNLRTRLINISKGDNPVTLVSSVGSNSDGTMVALNLAAAYALDAAKTALIVDCHIGHPKLDGILSIKSSRGLTDYLVDKTLGVASVLYQTGIPRLRLIPAGGQKESTAEFFTSLRMQAFLQAIKQRYPDRFVVLCAPSMDKTADSRILSDLCDKAVLVVGYGKVDESRLLDAANIVGREKLAGVVLNRVPRPPF